MDISSMSNSTAVPQPISIAQATATAPPATQEAKRLPKSVGEPVASLGPQATAKTEGEDKEELKDAVDSVNHSLKSLQNQSNALEFTVDHDLGRVIVRLVDTKTRNVIRQYPPEEVLEIARQMDKLVGKLLKDKA